MNDRAVTDVIGYVLVFSLIVATVGIVSTFGFAGLEDRQRAEQVNNVERAFDVFDHNVEDVYRREAPSRATEMRLGGGTLQYGESVSIVVSNATDESMNKTIETTPLVYSRGDTEIVYVAGAILRVDDGNAVMISDPDFLLETERVVVPLLEMRSHSSRSVSGESTIRVTNRLSFVDETVPPALAEPSGDVNITVESPRTEAWERYFGEQPGDVDADPANDRVTFTVDEPDRVSAPQFRIRLDFRR